MPSSLRYRRRGRPKPRLFDAAPLDFSDWKFDPVRGSLYLQKLTAGIREAVRPFTDHYRFVDAHPAERVRAAQPAPNPRIGNLYSDVT